MIVTITGSNDYQRKLELSRRVADFISEHGDMAVERLDGEDVSPGRLLEALQTLPFLSSRKLVVLQAPGSQKVFAETIDNTLAGVADVTDVIIHEPKLDKRSTYYKILKKKTDFQEFSPLDAAGLARWAMAYAKEQGATLSQPDALFIINRLRPDQQLLKHELQKLLQYDPHITRGTIELLVEATPQSSIFELLDAAFSGKTQTAFALYKEQRALRVEPQAIIAMLAWQLHILAVVKAAGSRSADDIAKTARLSPFVVRKSQSLTRRLELERIRRLIDDLLQLDIQLKRTAIDADEALQQYLLALAAGT